MAHGDNAKHKSNKQREIWSRRCDKVNSCPTSKWSKTITHRQERRNAKKIDE